MLDQIDRVCDGFEAAWVRGGRPQAEDWLEEVAPHYRKALLRDLLAAEIAARRRRGESPSPGEYRDRLPDDAAAVNSALGLKAVAPVAEPHDGLLMGLLAFQTGLVNRSTLVEALGAWMRDRAQPLSEVPLRRWGPWMPTAAPGWKVWSPSTSDFTAVMSASASRHCRPAPAPVSG